MGLFLHGPGSRGLGDLPICCFPERLMFNTVCTARQRSPAGDLIIPHSKEGTKRPPEAGECFQPSAALPEHQYVPSLNMCIVEQLGRWLFSSCCDSHVGFGTASSNQISTEGPQHRRSPCLGLLALFTTPSLWLGFLLHFFFYILKCEGSTVSRLN